MSNLTHLRYLLEDARSHYCYSGYQFFAESPSGSIRLWGGQTHYWPNAVPVTPETYFDIGSLTKVVFTTSLLARWHENRIIHLDDPVDKYVHPLMGISLGRLRIAHLLSHCSGLSPWEPFYRDSQGDLVAWFKNRQSELIKYQATRETRYSDVGFWLLGLVMTAIGGSLETLFENEIRVPLNLKCVFGPVSESTAATEFCRWRNRLLQGEVFDENSAAMGGIGAHAGLFASAEGMAPLIRVWLKAWRENSGWVSRDTARLFAKPSGLCAESTRGLGWDTKSAKNSSAGDYFSVESFGHLGFPGCSIWIDPVASGFVILLTNRIHPSRVDERIRKLRPLIHNEVAQIWSTYHD